MKQLTRHEHESLPKALGEAESVNRGRLNKSRIPAGAIVDHGWGGRSHEPRFGEVYTIHQFGFMARR